MCSICFEDDASTTLRCKHAFHMKCIMKWWCLQDGEPSCPMCRGEIGDEELTFLTCQYFSNRWLTSYSRGDKVFQKFKLKIQKNIDENFTVFSMEGALDAPEFVP